MKRMLESVGVGVAPKAAVLLLALLAGCRVGPASLERDYPRYSQTIRDIEDEHMLLNLVRMRYVETPVFLQISSISTTYGVSTDVSASATGASGGSTSGTLGVGGAYSETPTISYSLPDSREFFGRMVAPLSVAQLAPLAMGGVGGYFRMGLKRINRLENVSSYTGWTAERPATHAEFEEAMELFEELERAGLIDFTFNIAFIEASSPFDELDNLRALPEGETIGMEFWKNEDDQWVAYFGKRAPYLRFAASAADDPRAQRLRELLGLDPEKHSFPVVDVDFSKTEKSRIMAGDPAAALEPGARFGELVLVNRSMLEILLYASKSVQVPQRHLDAGLATEEADVFGDLLTVLSTDEEPTDAAIAVQHRGTWFYIADSDLRSKMTFTRLNGLFEVTAGRVAGSTPILTIPVN